MYEIGCGVAEITPAVGTQLSGFIFRENRPSTGIDDPLFVRALALRSAGQVFWLVDYELLGIGADLQRRIFTELRDGLGELFLPELCTIVAVHNHSGPPTMSLRGEAKLSPAYIDLLCCATTQAARAAVENLQPARLEKASIEISGLTYNRRALLVDGRVSMAVNPDATVVRRGPVDHRLTLLVWKSLAGHNLAAAVHFACHGVAVCTQSIGNDIPGAITRHFEHTLGVPCLFLQGAAGDVNPLVVSSERAEMLPWVAQFETAVYDLLDRLHPIESEPVTVRSETLALDYIPLPPRQQVLNQIQQFERIALGDVSSPEVAGAVRRLGDLMNVPPGSIPDAHKAAYCAQALLASHRDILAVIDREGFPDSHPLHLAVWRLGGVALAFAGAELFSQTGLKLRALSSELDVLPVTYATPVVGYIPDSDAMELGGYEVDFAWHFYGNPAPFAPQSELHVVDGFHRLLKAVYQST